MSMHNYIEMHDVSIWSLCHLWYHSSSHTLDLLQLFSGVKVKQSVGDLLPFIESWFRQPYCWLSIRFLLVEKKLHWGVICLLEGSFLEVNGSSSDSACSNAFITAMAELTCRSAAWRPRTLLLCMTYPLTIASLFCSLSCIVFRSSTLCWLCTTFRILTEPVASFGESKPCVQLVEFVQWLCDLEGSWWCRNLSTRCICLQIVWWMSESGQLQEYSWTQISQSGQRNEQFVGHSATSCATWYWDFPVEVTLHLTSLHTLTRSTPSSLLTASLHYYLYLLFFFPSPILQASQKPCLLQTSKGHVCIYPHAYSLYPSNISTWTHDEKIPCTC